jgi:DNA-3-methyladenine glycosylase II
MIRFEKVSIGDSETYSKLPGKKNHHRNLIHMIFKGLDSSSFKSALSHLAKIDTDLNSVIKKFGPPPMWSRDPGFSTLIYIVLEQQVSLASAKAAFERLKISIPLVTPGNFLELDDRELKNIGFSRQKMNYCRNIAIAIKDGSLPIDKFLHMADNTIRVELQNLKGVGPWTSDIYLLMALNRPDIWPVGDLALISAIQKVKNLPERPTVEEFKALGDPWKPWRAVAARILWHYYLSNQ